jgi:ribosome-associated toxin RatA of RatAB toxin-antitoxin module
MPYAAAQIYVIVADVAAYPQFLPWCGGVRILKQEGAVVEAEITIAKGPLKVAFATVNQLTLNERIDMRLAKGPFKQLAGGWVFESLDKNSCRVTLALDFEFNNRLLAMTVGSVFEQVVSSLIDAFLLRAKELYGS